MGSPFRRLIALDEGRKKEYKENKIQAVSGRFFGVSRAQDRGREPKPCRAVPGGRSRAGRHLSLSASGRGPAFAKPASAGEGRPEPGFFEGRTPCPARIQPRINNSAAQIRALPPSGERGYPLKILHLPHVQRDRAAKRTDGRQADRCRLAPTGIRFVDRPRKCGRGGDLRLSCGAGRRHAGRASARAVLYIPAVQIKRPHRIRAQTGSLCRP